MMLCESAALSMSANLEDSAVPQDWKMSVFVPIPKKGNAKECSKRKKKNLKTTYRKARGSE